MKSVCLICSVVFSVALTAWPQTSAPAGKPPASKKSASPSVQPAAAKKAAPKAPAKSAGKSAASTKKGSASVSKTASKTGSKTGRKAPVTAGNYRRGQQVPTSDRYREIQQALVDRGYLRSEPNGVWDQQSSDALKQFQTENNLSPTGKLSSLSLIQLGLGPKHEDKPITTPDPVEIPPEPTPLPLPAN